MIYLHAIPVREGCAISTVRSVVQGPFKKLALPS
jgi:hypothetical protein